MDSVFSILGFVIFGITFCVYAVLVESQLHESGPLPSPHSLRPHPPSLRPRPHPPSPRPRPPSPSCRSGSSRPHCLTPQPPPPLHSLSPPIAPSHPPPPNDRVTPPPPAHHLNGGKKVGLLFAGIAGIMQIGVVGFLVFKRRQLLKTKDTFETSA